MPVSKLRIVALKVGRDTVTVTAVNPPRYSNVNSNVNGEWQGSYPYRYRYRYSSKGGMVLPMGFVR